MKSMKRYIFRKWRRKLAKNCRAYAQFNCAYALQFCTFDVIYETYSYFCKGFSANYGHSIRWFSQSRAQLLSYVPTFLACTVSKLYPIMFHKIVQNRGSRNKLGTNSADIVLYNDENRACSQHMPWIISTIDATELVCMLTLFLPPDKNRPHQCWAGVQTNVMGTVVSPISVRVSNVSTRFSTRSAVSPVRGYPGTPS